MWLCDLGLTQPFQHHHCWVGSLMLLCPQRSEGNKSAKSSHINTCFKGSLNNINQPPRLQVQCALFGNWDQQLRSEIYIKVGTCSDRHLSPGRTEKSRNTVGNEESLLSLRSMRLCSKCWHVSVNPSINPTTTPWNATALQELPCLQSKTGVILGKHSKLTTGRILQNKQKKKSSAVSLHYALLYLLRDNVARSSRWFVTIDQLCWDCMLCCQEVYLKRS